MYNVKIDGIGNIDTVKSLFSEVDCLSNDNCFLVVQNYDYVGSLAGGEGQIATNSAVVGAKAGGVAGGIVGGIVGITLCTFILNTYLNLNISYLLMIPIGFVLSIISQIGDLAASTIKRYAGVKDFSNLIPGHGGMMDRLDSVMFVAPFVYYLFSILL